jgi:hypothetical protein
MAYRARKTHLKKYERWVADGGGAARGAQYTPYLSVRDVPSLGNVNRVLGWKTGRVHQFMSNLEFQFFLLLEWSDAVVDVNEQFPLDLSETQSIAEQLGLKHPTLPVTQLPNVMTSDFKIAIARGLEQVCRVVSIKPSSQLTERTLQKLEIERRYWAKRNVQWNIMTERDIDQTRVRNIQWLHPYGKLQYGLLPEAVSLKNIENLLREMVTAGGVLSGVALAFDDHLGLPEGSGLTLVRHFLASKIWRVNMDVPINPSQPLALLNLPKPN